MKCTSSVRGSSGYAEGVHELDPNHDEILKNNKVITVAESLLQSGTTDYSDLTFELPDSPAAQAAQATAGRKSADKQQDSPAEVQPSVEASQPASTAQKKSTNSTQKKSASTTSQSTRKTTTKGEKLDMSLTMDVPEGGQLAVIYTPNTGKCSLREKASNSSKLIKQCKAGHLVLVLEKGSQFTKINDNGYVGYVQTRCLQFFDELPEAIGTAKLSYNGKATGGTTVNVRHTASKKSRKVEEWRTGTTVTVFSYADGWYEIEHDGVYGYVMDEFLIMDTAQE
ncbi:MAG: SH3 domain-containing protein [Clostridia bacterium]|nr:SH3 domain-containing protein [Clostridia bacterium]